MSDKLCLLYVLYPNKKTAQANIKKLLVDRLIVCANIIRDIESVYRWQDRIEKSKETIVIFKTTSNKINRARKVIIDEHPYKVPFVGELNLRSVNKAYALYASKQLKHTAAKLK